MTTPAAMTLAQWLSPAYPVGAFAYSHGLEQAVAGVQVRDPETLADWLETVLDRGAGRSDALFLAAAYRADAVDLADVDAIARAFAASAERLVETELQGAAFVATTEAVWGEALGRLVYPVALGRAARLNGLPVELTASMYLHAVASNLVSAALRLMPLGQTAGQHIVHALAPLCARIAAETRDGDLDTLSATAFLADIASMRHETLEPRIFRT